ncbi:hypothetical protein HGRIS_004426 [Hohenbuehelia grisea]
MFAFSDMDTDLWRKGRKAIHPLVTPTSIDRHLPIHQIEGLQLLGDILDNPKDTYYHIRRATASILTSLVYGHRSLGYRGTRIEKFYQMVELMNITSDPNAHPPVDLIPILRYVPARWAPWKTICDRLHAIRRELYGTLLSEVEQGMATGTAPDCLIADLLRDRDSLDMTMDEIDTTGATIMDAGSETSSSYLQNFVLMLANHPNFQRHAQREIDRVIGTDRLPNIEDFDKLPYVQALIQELHRFRPLLPMALPHVATQDVIYKAYRIPKGSTIFMNIWGIYHNPDLFDDPGTFNPERYLASRFGVKADVDTSSFKDDYVFGAGRRACPGKDMANRTIALYTMYLLWAFDFSKDGSDCSDLSLDQYAKPGFELAPLLFTLSIKPRDVHRESLIRRSLQLEGLAS